MTKHKQILAWAELGASERLKQIETEERDILHAFPDLGRHTRKPAKATLKRRKMSAAARARMSAGMRKYWRRRRAETA